MPLRRRVRAWPGIVVCLAMVVGISAACDTTTYVLGDLLEDPDASGGNGGAPTECLDDGAECSLDSECCGNLCLNAACTQRSPSCIVFGQACDSPLECCSQACVDGRCEERCVSDGVDCTQDAQCCSGICDSGFCTPLSTQCRTAGNTCVQDAECCSELCWQGHCDRDASFCAQAHESCREDADCCSGGCIFGGGELGTCAEPPSGPSNCTNGIAGSLCGSCNDCCSRLCVPYGTRGIQVCAQAEGCRQTGELCARDEDCCGGDPDSLLPGAGNVTCRIDAGNTFGICRNAISCSPQGNVCHIQDYACGVSAAANKCCGADGEEGTCFIDDQGVPRCNGLGSSCNASGEPCAIDDDCCAGACRPNEEGLLRCDEGAACVSMGSACTASSECCPGTLCEKATTTAFGTCESTSHSVTCSLSGQLCGGTYPSCCTGTICGSSGRCVTAEGDATML